MLVRGDARALPLPDSSVDLIVTSPPYFNQRDYRDDGGSLAGQIGAERTPREYIDALLNVTRECMRVLKPTGSLFVNLGDKYATAGTRHGNSGISDYGGDPRTYYGTPPAGTRDKSQMLLPERYRIGCVDELGLIARAVIVWAKPNCLSGGTTVYAKVQGRPTPIKVHDLCRHYEPEDVQLWNGQRWTQVVWWQPTGRHPDAAESYKAIRAARRRSEDPVVGGDIEIELRSGERIGCTREHRWPTHRGLVHASDLVAGDVLDTAPLPEGDVIPTALDDEMIGWFVGLYIAEGSRSGQTIQIAGHVKELERFKRLSETAAAFHGTARAHATGGNTATINLTGNMLRAILDTYVGGRTAKDKCLAPKCWQRSNRFLRAVLDGYLSGDGHWREDAHRWILGFTNNDALAADMRTLGARLGLSVRLKRVTHTGFGKEWPGWGGHITDPHRRRQMDSEIVAVRQSRARQFWDIGVEDEPHLFSLASGVLTHNSLPESVTDRVRCSHEYVYHFTKSPRYYSAVDEIREPHKYPGDERFKRQAGGDYATDATGHINSPLNPLGKLPGSVWTIPAQPLNVPDHVAHARCCDGRKRPGCEDGLDHYAAFPFALVRPIILGWSPLEVCTACGEGRRPVADHTEKYLHRPSGAARIGTAYDVDRPGRERGNVGTVHRITGYACSCPDVTAPATPGIVVDPCGGTGSTALVAAMAGRIGVSNDASWDYGDLIARWRVNDPHERARAAGLDPAAVAAIPRLAPGQASLFDGATP